MDLTLSYRALRAGQVDLIAGDATAGLIKGLDLAPLDDNRALLSARMTPRRLRARDAAALLRGPSRSRRLVGADLRPPICAR